MFSVCYGNCTSLSLDRKLMDNAVLFAGAVTTQHVSVCYGEAGDGSLHNQLPRQTGHTGTCPLLSTEATCHYTLHGVPSIQRTPGRYATTLCYCYHRCTTADYLRQGGYVLGSVCNQDRMKNYEWILVNFLRFWHGTKRKWLDVRGDSDSFKDSGPSRIV